jgi:hypothetical protein
MSETTNDLRFTHTDLDGDTLTVRGGMLSTVIEVKSQDVGFEGAVAIRFEHLPELIAVLQRTLDEASK